MGERRIGLIWCRISDQKKGKYIIEEENHRRVNFIIEPGGGVLKKTVSKATGRILQSTRAVPGTAPQTLLATSTIGLRRHMDSFRGRMGVTEKRKNLKHAVQKTREASRHLCAAQH